ncbi:MAG: ATP-binding protein [Erysipelotrichaceae bacterium]|nr:ATP-binding protein [Erysipelotrichaceae bacterium]
MYQRTIFNRIVNSLKHYPVVIVTGPRQVGKSTEVYKLVQVGFHYVSLDNISSRREALEDPEFFIQQHGTPLIIDEIQYAPILMEVIESIVNEKRLKDGNANGMFVLTGSQTFSMMKGVTQSLAGRASILKMMPLSYSEIVGKEENPFLPSLEIYHKAFESINVNDLYKIIVRGMYPELYKDKDSDTFEYYENYVNTYIDRDVSELINIKDKLAFHNFLQYIATLTSQQVNYSDIAKNIGVDSKTIKSWISILETSGIIYLLQPYSEYKLSKRVTKSPKLYFCDTGLATHLARVNNPEYLMISNLAGAFMETYVMNEIKKSYENNGLKFNGYYYRDNHQNEIDLILIDNMKLHCIEIKKGSMFEKKHVKSFNQLAHSQYEMGTSCIICNTEKNYAINRDILVLSVSCI